MKQEDLEILKQLGKDSGFKVPENYFDNFCDNLMEQLPEVTITDTTAKPNLWVRVRPFVYMAAMFAGVWLMMTVFNQFNGTSTSGNIPQIAAGVEHNEKNADEMMMNGLVSDYDLYNYEDSVVASEEENK